MAELPSEDRARIWRGLQRHWSNDREPVGVSKDELRAAIDAADTWINDNQAGFNASLPTAARDNLTQAQKTLLFCAVALARVNIPFLRKILGEVD